SKYPSLPDTASNLAERLRRRADPDLRPVAVVLDLTLDRHPELPGDLGRGLVLDPDHRDDPARDERSKRTRGLGRVAVAPELPANEPAELDLVTPGELARDEADEAHGVSRLAQHHRVHADIAVGQRYPAAQAGEGTLAVEHRLRRGQQTPRRPTRAR